MRLAHGFVLLAVLALTVARASAANTTTNNVTNPNITTQMHVQPLQLNRAACPPGPGGFTVNIPGIGQFAAQSVALETTRTSTVASTHLAISEAQSHGRGSIKITKQYDVASPKLLQAQTHSSVLPTVTITMRKAGGAGQASAYEVWTLSNASILSGERQGSVETLVFSYQSIAVKQCAGGSEAK